MPEQPVIQHHFSTRHSEPLVGVLLEEDGQEFVRYFGGDVPTGDDAAAALMAEATRLAGAWSDLDWDQAADELDRIRHAAPPTPPIEL